MKMSANGSFEVNLTPQAKDITNSNSPINRLTIDKQFHGDLEAASKGQMLSSMSNVEGSAGYVALEHVVGRLNSLEGSFVLQHSGTMAQGEGQLSITVVPDSRTGQLERLAGTMTIDNANDVHSYSFEYTLSET